MDLPVQTLTGEASPNFLKGPVGPYGDRPFEDRASSPRREYVEEGGSRRMEEHSPWSEIVSIHIVRHMIPRQDLWIIQHCI